MEEIQKTEEEIMREQMLHDEEQRKEEKRLMLEAELHSLNNEVVAVLANHIKASVNDKKALDVLAKFESVINQLDELGKVIQTLEGNGTMENPFKGWKVGMSVEKGCWYLTESGYLWEALASGTPASETDRAFFDVVGL